MLLVRNFTHFGTLVTTALHGHGLVAGVVSYASILAAGTDKSTETILDLSLPFGIFGIGFSVPVP